MNLFELFPYALNVGNYSGDVLVVVLVGTFCVGRIICVIRILVVVLFFKYLLKLVECPRRELACLE